MGAVAVLAKSMNLEQHLATLASTTDLTTRQRKAKELAALLKLITFVGYSAKVITPDETLEVQGTIPVSTLIDSEWQVYCYLLSVYGEPTKIKNIKLRA